MDLICHRCGTTSPTADDSQDVRRLAVEAGWDLDPWGDFCPTCIAQIRREVG